MTWAMLRVKNESRWIARVIRSIQPVTHRIIILDDHSTDNTASICKKLDCTVIPSPYPAMDLDEARDKNRLLSSLWSCGALPGDYVLSIDGDELLNPPDLEHFRVLSCSSTTTPRLYSFKIEYLWDREDQLRVDGLYSHFYRPSLFPLTNRGLTFHSTHYGGNFHCGSVPTNLCAQVIQSPHVRLIHFGYLHREDRIRKYRTYNLVDPSNSYEDSYRHMVCGDIAEVPASSKLKWAGPLALEPSPFQIQDV